MRLLNVQTLQFHEFFDHDVPAYVILSHTWGKSEMSYQQFRSLFPPEDKFARLMHLSDKETIWRLLHHHKGLDGDQDGLTKILKFCQLVYKTNAKWVWVDSCCINKESSAELSEAINSMYNWYKSAEVCWAFLKDAKVVSGDSATSQSNIYSVAGSITFEGLKSFQVSRWFKRGWTLQELLAPADVRFFDKNWNYFGTKYGLAREINKATSIDSEILISHDSASLLEQFTVAEKMSWAAYRETTRIEDIAYSLLGIFGITMTLQYGEGKSAFQRLQKKILKTTSDETLLAWDTEEDEKVGSLTGLLATHPRAFVSAKDMVPLDVEYIPVMTSSRGASISIHYPDRVRETLNDHSNVMLPLNCTRQNSMVCIPIFNYRGNWYRVSRRLGDESNIRLLGSNSARPVRTLDRSQRDVLYISLTPTSMPLRYPKAHVQVENPTVAIRLDTHEISQELLRMSLPSEMFAEFVTFLRRFPQLKTTDLGASQGLGTTTISTKPEDPSKRPERRNGSKSPLRTNHTSPRSLALVPELSQDLRSQPISFPLKTESDDDRENGISAEDRKPSMIEAVPLQKTPVPPNLRKATDQQLTGAGAIGLLKARSKPRLSMGEYLRYRSRTGTAGQPAYVKRALQMNDKEEADFRGETAPASLPHVA